MPRFNVSLLRYLSKEDFRVLNSLEVGMRNHELVPLDLISGISQIPQGQIFKILKSLSQDKLVSFQHKKHSKIEGYRLTFLGYDYLALKALSSRDTIASVGNQIGKGKESDVYVVANEGGDQFCLKIHRLGRTSNRNMVSKRDYLSGFHHVSWLYLSRMAAHREFCFLGEMFKNGINVPKPIDCNRHCVVMELIPAFPLNHVREVRDPVALFDDLIHVIVQLAALGYVHGDFNEFNLLVDDEGKVTLIDLPQMLTCTHPLAKSYLKRDLGCVRDFFRRRFGVDTHEISVDSIKLGDVKEIKELDGEFTDEMLVEHIRNNPTDLDLEYDSAGDDNLSEPDELDISVDTPARKEEEHTSLCVGIESVHISEHKDILTGEVVKGELESEGEHLGMEDPAPDAQSDVSSVLSMVDIKMQAKRKVRKELMKEKHQMRSCRKQKGKKDPKGKGKKFSAHVTSEDFYL